MIALFGGTFDPVHRGHLHGAAAVCDALGAESIAMVLSARPGHRGSPGASAEHRWEMLCLACADDERLVPDDRELNRDRPSYTVDTLLEIRKEVGDESLVWVLGSDAYADLASWHRWREVLSLANLVVLQRPGGPRRWPAPVDELTARHRVDAMLDAPCGQILFLKAPMQDVSASEIRAAIAGGRPVGHLLPERVATYISRHGLYGAPSDS
ncbi:MAG: nicotinate-nucleotide adenylyltransferase [Pseudomonadales bacterium]|nr:nicotinate-nucleotide adenylyltransferase [Pseudomonadales bacterium]NIX09524.1 nicotinate-nucleotide adenylyltransferase [Pseudomonadales bacterium]